MMSVVNNVRGGQTIDIALLLRDTLDGDAIVAQLQASAEFRVVGTSTSVAEFAGLCERAKARVALIDVSYSAGEEDVFAVGRRLMGASAVEFILYLDDRPNHVRALRAVRMAKCGYFTRRRTVRQLTAALLDLVEGHTVLDGFELADLRANRKLQPPKYAGGSRLSQLTMRELDVLQLLAEGMSVEQCAACLHVSATTVRSHKARLMNKLGVHRASELTLIAVREGLVVP